MLNKILALRRIRVIFTGYDHRVWRNIWWKFNWSPFTFSLWWKSKKLFKTTHSLASEKFSHKSLQCAKKIKCKSLRTLESSIGTITIFTRRSGSGPVRYTDSTACPECWQNESSQVLSLCQHFGHRMAGRRVRATDRAAASTSSESWGSSS